MPLVIVMLFLASAPHPDRVDFANFRYPAIEACFPNGKVTGPIVLRHGKFDAIDKSTLLETETSLHSVAYGGLRGDGSLQAAVILSCDAYGLPGMYNQGFLFDVQGVKATLIAIIAGGTEDSGIEKIQIARGLLLVDRCGEDGCQQSELDSYRLVGRSLKLVAVKHHRTVTYPSY